MIYKLADGHSEHESLFVNIKSASFIIYGIYSRIYCWEIFVVYVNLPTGRTD